MPLEDKLPKPPLPAGAADGIRARESYHLLKILSEFVEGGEALQAIQPAVSIYGSARTPADSPYYTMCEQLSRRLSDAGFSVISGGGPGIMEAANKGAFYGKSPSVGLNIVLPHEPQASAYQDLSVRFKHFFPRKVMFVKHAVAYVAFPGGFGTMDELFESITLMQTGKSPRRPVILAGTAFWSGLTDWIRGRMLADGYIGADDPDMLYLTDDIDEIVDRIFIHYEQYGAGTAVKEEDGGEWLPGL